MIRYSGMENVPGAPGNTLYSGVDLPFGGGGRYRTIQEQYRPGQRREDPVRSFPKNEPGREGAIDIDFRRALMNSPSAVGNMGGMMAMLPGGEQGSIQGFQNVLNTLPLPQIIQGGSYRYEEEIRPSGFDRKFVY